MKFDLVPLPLDEANAFVAQHHRHHGRVIGHKFSIGVATAGPDGDVQIRGVAIVSRPVAHGLDDGLTLEITRVATDGAKDACSALYGACRRAAFALGYKKLVTYTLASENGSSLRAAGYRLVGEVRGRSWSCQSRAARGQTSNARETALGGSMTSFRTGSGNGAAERPARGTVSVAGHRGAADADEASSSNSAGGSR